MESAVNGAEISQYWDNGCAGGAKALEAWGGVKRNPRNGHTMRTSPRIARKPKVHYLAFGESPLRLRLVHGFENEFEFEDD
jgi:hypothetical protein